MNTEVYFGQARNLYVAGFLLLTVVVGSSSALADSSAISAPSQNATVSDVRHFLDQGKKPASCSAFLPADATPVRDLHICRSRHDGKNTVYACQDFASGDEFYRVLFKGGRNPKAITALAADGEAGRVIWSEDEETDPPVCSLAPPPQAPATNQFVGVGVCKDDAGQSVPCAVFRRKAPRAQITTDYLVFYHADGSGPQRAIPMYVETDPDALPAELAFQIGRRLVKSRCCRHRGLQYLQYASQAYPDSNLYRKALQESVGEQVSGSGQ